MIVRGPKQVLLATGTALSQLVQYMGYQELGGSFEQQGTRHGVSSEQRLAGTQPL